MSGYRELRLALVCTGGVSLAVYMFGITREIQELLIASAENDAGDEGAHESTTIRRIYREALARTGRDSVPVKVVVDTIAGTSAGGIDGVYLAKAIAGDLSQDPLRELWFEQADIRKLLAGTGPAWFKVALFIGRLLFSGGRVEAPLGGRRMIRLIHEGLKQMDQEDARPGGNGTLIPPNQSLDLYITLTDGRGYRRLVNVVPGGELLQDRTHRHVLHFRATPPDHSPGASGSGRKNQFSAAYNRALTFAARATSSFPGAFPPVTLADFGDEVSLSGLGEFDPERFCSEFFAEYGLLEEDPRKSWFVDGGVLDNHPFGHAIKAIERKGAGAEVDRRIVYVQPSPAGQPIDHPETGTAARRGGAVKLPSWLETILAAKTTIPAHEPILDEILSLRNRNDRIRRLAVLATEQLSDILHVLSSHPGWQDGPDYENIRPLIHAMHEEAERRLGIHMETYRTLRLQSLAANLGDAVCSGFGYPNASSPAALIRDILTVWIGRIAAELEDAAGSMAFLSLYDLPFRERRLRFIIEGLNLLYKSDMASPDRPAVDRLKFQLYEALDRLWNLPGRMGSALDLEAYALFGQAALRPWLGKDPSGFIAEHVSGLEVFLNDVKDWMDAELNDLERHCWELMHQATRSWAPEVGTGVLARFLGFPLWDVTSFPVTALSQVPQSTPINVNRFNPDDALALQWEGPKLLSTDFKSFGGFFERRRRENDFLWGRLDAVELLLRLIDPEIDDRTLAAAFRCVLQEEHALGVLAGDADGDLRPRLEAAIAGLESRPTGQSSSTNIRHKLTA